MQGVSIDKREGRGGGVSIYIIKNVPKRCKRCKGAVSRSLVPCNTPFAVHYEKTRIHLCETATNSAKIHSLAQKIDHLRLNQIQ